MSREAAIKALLARHGFRFSKSMGQNFLVDQEVPERIAEESFLTPETHVLEIGPGIGALTNELCARAGFVSAIELDTSLLPLLDETMADFENYEIISGDMLKLDLAQIMATRAELPRKVVCANLPYNITAPAVTALLEAGVFESITVMVQREVARRFAAKPGSKDYGAFTIFVNYHASAEILFDVPPDSFIPAPKVTSAVVKLTPHVPPEEISDAAMFFRTVKAAFAMRRKTLVNALSAGGFGFSKEELTNIVAECGINVTARGETLGIPEFAQLADRLTR